MVNREFWSRRRKYSTDLNILDSIKGMHTCREAHTPPHLPWAKTAWQMFYLLKHSITIFVITSAAREIEYNEPKFRQYKRIEIYCPSFQLKTTATVIIEAINNYLFS